MSDEVCPLCGKTLTRFEMHEKIHCIEYLRERAEKAEHTIRFLQRMLIEMSPATFTRPLAVIDDYMIDIDPVEAENAQLRADAARLNARIGMKDDALFSYAEFYERAASLCGLQDDALPSTETDAIILQRLAEHDEIERLTAALQENETQLDFASRRLDCLNAIEEVINQRSEYGDGSLSDAEIVADAFKRIDVMVNALDDANADAAALDVEVDAFLGCMEPGKDYDEVSAKHEAHLARVESAKIGGL